MRDANPQTIYLKDYRPPEYRIRSVDLNFDLDQEDTRVITRMRASRNPENSGGGTEMTLLGEGMVLVSIELDGEVLPETGYRLTEDGLTLHRVPQDREFVLKIENRINPKANTALEGLYLSNGMLCTQCEAEGFRKITWFLDRPDVMTRFTTTLCGDKDRYPVLLSNGNKIAEGELENGRHWVTWEDPFDKPCYLFALVAGKLECIEDRFTTASGREVRLQIFVEAHDVDKCDHAMASLQNAMRWDEEVYGREYDLDLYMIVAVGHFNMGAMENKGLNVFNTKFVLARPDTATDADYEHIEGVIGHEYFHNWTGNRITCRDWFQLSLKEGLTVFRDQEFTGDRTSRAVKRIEDVNMLRNRQFVEDAGPMAHPVRPDAYIEINNFYTVTVYEKGAEVVRMIHTLLGAENFRKGMDLYFSRHDGQAVTCDDFVKAMEDAGNIDLSRFRLWYSQAGTPELQVESRYEGERRVLALTLRQSCPPTPGQPRKEPMHIPVRMGFLDKSGNAMPVRLLEDGREGDEFVLELKEKEHTFLFDAVAEKPVLSLLRGFSAPVKLHMERSLEELAFLLSHDPDAFNRWEAGQQLAYRVILDLAQGMNPASKPGVSEIFLAAYGDVLDKKWDDLSYLSLLLTLPSENYLAESMEVVDVEAIHRAREHVGLALAENFRGRFERIYREHHREESGRFDSEAIGRRRLKNVCLHYLGKLENDEVYRLSERQFQEARNMTDQIAALGVIVDSRHPSKQECLETFYRQWCDEALVVDKWFALQAASPMPEAFETVCRLMEHPAFDIKTPNRVRSLIGVFSQSNPLHFHAADGRGYRFLADQIIALNRINPQVASRMSGAFTQWRRFDASRQKLIRQELQRIMSSPDICTDVYEVVSKSLS